MKLRQLLQGIPVLDAKANLDVLVTAIVYDSRKVIPGSLFVAITGFANDGNRYISEAMLAGAVAVVTSRRPPERIPYVLVENDRETLALLSCQFYEHPARAMTVIGVTGTNGKTSVTMLLKQVLEKTIFAKVGLIGTVQNMIGDKPIPANRTTPESLELQQLLFNMRNAGCTHVVMEVSSHAIALYRTAGICFNVAAFTNLSEDHLDFHRSMEEYCDTKSRLFQNCYAAVMNRDDPWFERIRANLSCSVLTTAVELSADIRAEDISLFSDGISFTAVSATEKTAVYLPIPGNFTVNNTLTVLGISDQLGIPRRDVAAALASAKGIPGRVEPVPTPGRAYSVLIDYAHTPDGLEKLLQSVRQFCRGRIILVFGCGGNRDKTKRPLMGRIAVQLSDMMVITSDNPRYEKPSDIILDILSGVPNDIGNYKVIENRQKAIRYAMDIAEKRDIIILAGKGHETFQEIQGVKYPLDEREEVAAYLRETEE